MFKKISCVAFLGVAASLISAVEPAQAFSFHSGSSSYGNSLTSNSLGGNSLSGGNGLSTYSLSTSSSIAQGPAISGGGTVNWPAWLIGLLMIWMVEQGLDTDGDDVSQEVLNAFIADNQDDPAIVEAVDKVNQGNNGGGNNGGGNNGGGEPPEPVPSPALLPGLVGMGIAAMRKRKQVQVSEQV